MLSREELLDLPGLPESRLSAALRDRVPATSAPAPWSAAVRAVLWWHRSTPATASLLADDAPRKRLPLTICALIDYLHTPVGPYREILVSAGLLLDGRVPAASIPFIAVDSIASVHGGRANWGLPKTLAQFGHAELEGERCALIEGEAEDGSAWSLRVRARARRRPVALPVTLRVRDRQFLADGSSLDALASVRGPVRLGRVDVDPAGPGLTRLIRAGSHPALCIDRAEVGVGAARRRPA